MFAGGRRRSSLPLLVPANDLYLIRSEEANHEPSTSKRGNNQPTRTRYVRHVASWDENVNA